MSKILHAIVFLSILITQQALQAQTGSLDLRLFEYEKSDPAVGAMVVVDGKEIGAYTDEDGRCMLQSIPPGEHSLLVRLAPYPDSLHRGIEVVEGQTTVMDLNIRPVCEYDSSRGSKKCPVCGKKSQVVPVVYGLQVGQVDEKKLIYAGKEISACDPNWYCRRDSTKF